MFSKRPQDLTPSDIGTLITDQVQESDQVEFKEALSAARGMDSWHSGAAQVGDRARNDIIREIVAFGNAHGGELILGIEESDDHPHRAVSVKPIPRCADLAARIKMFCRDMIEPQIPIVEISAVPMEGDAGVVVIKIEQSRSAPHRSRASLQCYVRRADRTEALTMREIQDLTLQVERGLGLVENRFKKCADDFEQGHSPELVLAFRATCIPLTKISVPGVPGDRGLYPELRELNVTVPPGRQTNLIIPFRSFSWRPVLRGARTDEADSRKQAILQIQTDGSIEFAFRFFRNEYAPKSVYATWFMAIVGNALRAIEKARVTAGATAVEYGLELELRNKVSGKGAMDYNASEGMESGMFPTGRYLLPRYSVGDVTEFPTLMQLIEKDFWNAAGRNFDSSDCLIIDLAEISK